MSGDETKRSGEDGGGMVLWRANAQKGQAYRRSDVDLLVTDRVRSLLGRLIRDPPNPEGP